MNKKLVVFGTRPEFIKLIPVIEEIRLRGIRKDFIFLFTGQHNELVQELFHLFDFAPDLKIAEKNHQNSLSFSFSFILKSLQEMMDELKKNDKLTLVLAQGDTTSCACASVCAFFNEIPFAHVEAGLRTGNFKHPFPEEYFRKLVSLSTHVHFAPTEIARQNLLAEGVNADAIQVTGNTIVDAVEMMLSKRLKKTRKEYLNPTTVLITCHRRENQNGRFLELIRSIVFLAKEYPDLNFIWVSHKTPFIENKLSFSNFGDLPNVSVTPPITILDMIELYTQTKLILTDSGGIQEEAVSFGIPVIVLREFTERKESVELGYSLVCSDMKDDLIEKFKYLLESPKAEMKSPYGDGLAAKRIVDYLIQHFN